MRLACKQCPYKTPNLADLDALDIRLQIDGGTADSFNRVCPNGHDLELQKVYYPGHSRKRLSKGAQRHLGLVQPSSTAGCILAVAATLDDEFDVSDLMMAAWKKMPMRLGMRGYELDHPCTKRIQSDLSKKLKGLVVNAGSPRWYRVSKAGHDLIKLWEKQHAASNGKAPTEKRQQPDHVCDRQAQTSES